MITQDQFIERVRSHSIPRRTGIDDVDELMFLITRCWDIERCSSHLDEQSPFFVGRESTTHPKIFKLPGWALFFNLDAEAKEAVEDTNLMDSFVYDRTSKTVILNINRGAHESLMGYLFAAYTGKDISFSRRDCERAAESYITKGMGFSLSSAGNHPIKGHNVCLDFKEENVFESFEFLAI